MTFRDDHDAALARAEMLQRRLEEAESSQETTEAELEAAREEIAALRAQLSVPAPTPTPEVEVDGDPFPDIEVSHEELEQARLELSEYYKHEVGFDDVSPDDIDHETAKAYVITKIRQPARRVSSPMLVVFFAVVVMLLVAGVALAIVLTG